MNWFYRIKIQIHNYIHIFLEIFLDAKIQNESKNQENVFEKCIYDFFTPYFGSNFFTV